MRNAIISLITSIAIVVMSFSSLMANAVDKIIDNTFVMNYNYDNGKLNAVLKIDGNVCLGSFDAELHYDKTKYSVEATNVLNSDSSFLVNDVPRKGVVLISMASLDKNIEAASELISVDFLCSETPQKNDFSLEILNAAFIDDNYNSLNADFSIESNWNEPPLTTTETTTVYTSDSISTTSITSGSEPLITTTSDKNNNSNLFILDVHKKSEEEIELSLSVDGNVNFSFAEGIIALSLSGLGIPALSSTSPDTLVSYDSDNNALYFNIVSTSGKNITERTLLFDYIFPVEELEFDILCNADISYVGDQLYNDVDYSVTVNNSISNQPAVSTTTTTVLTTVTSASSTSASESVTTKTTTTVSSLTTRESTTSTNTTTVSSLTTPESTTSKTTTTVSSSATTESTTSKATTTVSSSAITKSTTSTDTTTLSSSSKTESTTSKATTTVSSLATTESTTTTESSSTTSTTTREITIEIKNADGNEILGAEFEIWHDEDGNRIIDKITDLIPGINYILSVVKVPSGYVPAPDIEFTIDSNGKISSETSNAVNEIDNSFTISLEKTKLSITKKDSESGDSITGARLMLTDDNGIIIEEWISLSTPHIIEGKLDVGKTYLVFETSAPSGYELADTVSFTVNSDGKIQYVDVIGKKITTTTTITITTTTTSTTTTSTTTTATTTATTTTTASELLPDIGDVNEDGDVNLADATMVLSIYANSAAGADISSFTDKQLKIADVDKDGKISINDATAILTYYANIAAGLDTSWNEILGK